MLDLKGTSVMKHVYLDKHKINIKSVADMKTTHNKCITLSWHQGFYLFVNGGEAHG